MLDLWVIGLLGFPVLFALLLIGAPIGLALLVTGIIGSIAVIGIPATLNLMGTAPFHVTAVWGFVTLPMFLLMGGFALHAGIGEDAYRAAYMWFGRIRGGLAMTTTAASAAFSFASGSSVATAAMFSRIALPEMTKHNYDKKLACGSIAVGGTLAVVIPPSALMVIYTMFAEEVSLGKLMIGGIFPGLLTAAFYVLIIYLWTRLKPEAGPAMAGPPIPLREKIAAIRWLGWVIIIGVCVLGGIYFGVFTPTEAGALGAFFTFVILLIRRGLKLEVVREAVLDAAGTTAMIFLIVIGAIVFSRFLAVSGLIGKLGVFLVEQPVAPVVIVMMVLGLYLILGAFMDPIGQLALTLPIFLPVMGGLGINEIWFGLLVIMLMEIGLLTPPLGLTAYAVKAVAGDYVTVEEVFKGVIPFLLSDLSVVAIIISFPPIVLWLPGLM